MAADTTSSEIQVHRRLGQIDFRLEVVTMRDQETIESRIKEYLKMLGYQVIEKLNKTYFKRGTIWSTRWRLAAAMPSTIWARPLASQPTPATS